MEATEIITTLDTVIGRITKSKKWSSVRDLQSIRDEIAQNGLQSSVNTVIPAPIERPALLPLPDGSEPYVQQNGEVDEVISYVASEQNLLLAGDTGCGKTHLVKHVAAILGKTLYTIQGEEGMRKEDIIGYRDITGGDTAYTYGVLPKAMKDPNGLLYWDEPNATPAGIQFICYSAMDLHRRSIVLTENGGEVIKAVKGFTFIGAMNEGKNYRGTTEQSASWRDRWQGILDLDYLPEARERKLLVDRTGIDAQIAAKLAAAARQLRAACQRKTDGVTTPISTRSLIAACTAVMHGVPIERAIILSIINKVSGIRLPERKAWGDILEVHLGLKKGK